MATKTKQYEKEYSRFERASSRYRIASGRGSRDKGGKKLEGIPSIGGGQISDHGNIISNKMVYISEEHYGQMKKGHLQLDF